MTTTTSSISVHRTKTCPIALGVLFLSFCVCVSVCSVCMGETVHIFQVLHCTLPLRPCRLLEVNGHSVTSATPEGVKTILQSTSGAIQLVIARQKMESTRRADSDNGAVARQMQEVEDSLQEELKAERKEAQKWRELYEQ